MENMKFVRKAEIIVLCCSWFYYVFVAFFVLFCVSVLLGDYDGIRKGILFYWFSLSSIHFIRAFHFSSFFLLCGRILRRFCGMLFCVHVSFLRLYRFIVTHVHSHNTHTHHITSIYSIDALSVEHKINIFCPFVHIETAMSLMWASIPFSS